MDSIHQPTPAARDGVAWTRDADSNVVRIHRAKPPALIPLGRCSYHEAALAEEQARPRK